MARASVGSTLQIHAAVCEERASPPYRLATSSTSSAPRMGSAVTRLLFEVKKSIWVAPQRSSRVRSSMRSDIAPGATFPDYELTDHTAKRRKLSELQGTDPLILLLSRGGYCPKDRRQMEELLVLHRELEVGYCKLVTITTDNLLETNEFRSGVGAHWPFLSDPARKIQKDLDIAEYTDPQHNPMIPHTVVLEPGLVVYKIYNGYWYFGRPSIEE